MRPLDGVRIGRRLRQRQYRRSLGHWYSLKLGFKFNLLQMMNSENEMLKLLTCRLPRLLAALHSRGDLLPRRSPPLRLLRPRLRPRTKLQLGRRIRLDRGRAGECPLPVAGRLQLRRRDFPRLSQ